MNRVAGRRFADHIRRSSLPLFNVPLTVFALLVLNRAHGLPWQERAVVTGVLGAGLNRF